MAKAKARAGASRRGLGAKLGVLGMLLFWAFGLLVWEERMEAAVPVHRIFLAACTLWLLLNAYLWMVPSWRRTSIERRGALLGFGFAFAAALVSALVDGIARGAPAGAGLFAWRMALLAAPFALPFRIGRRPYPHPLDALVLLYALLLPHLPGFGGLWWTTPDAGPVLGMRAGGIGPGHLAAATLLTTYFYAVRTWSAAPLDGLCRRGDLRRAAGGAALALGLTAAVTALPGAGAQGEPWAGRQEFFVWLLVGVGFAAFVEELAVRGLLLAGLRHWLPKEALRPAWAQALLVPVVALCHAALGSYGLGRLEAFGLSLGIGAVNLKAPRLLPAYLAHAAALAAIGAARLYG